MKYLLDTNAVIAILKKDPKFINNLKKYRPSDFVLSSIVLFELMYGVEKSIKKEENRRKVEILPFDILPFGQKEAICAGKIRAELEASGKPIGVYDTLIATHTIANNLTLITHNTREFSRITQLKYEDWQLH